MSRPRPSAASLSASAGSSATLIPPALPRPPVSTCALTTTWPPSSSAAARASSGLVARRPSETGIPKRRKSSLPWYSYRSKAAASVPTGVCEHADMRRAAALVALVVGLAGCGGGEAQLPDLGPAPPTTAPLGWVEHEGAPGARLDRKSTRLNSSH